MPDLIGVIQQTTPLRAELRQSTIAPGDVIMQLAATNGKQIITNIPVGQNHYTLPVAGGVTRGKVKTILLTITAKPAGDATNWDVELLDKPSVTLNGENTIFRETSIVPKSGSAPDPIVNRTFTAERVFVIPDGGTDLGLSITRTGGDASGFNATVQVNGEGLG